MIQELLGFHWNEKATIRREKTCFILRSSSFNLRDVAVWWKLFFRKSLSTRKWRKFAWKYKKKSISDEFSIHLIQYLNIIEYGVISIRNFQKAFPSEMQYIYFSMKRFPPEAFCAFHPQIVCQWIRALVVKINRSFSIGFSGALRKLLAKAQTISDLCAWITVIVNVLFILSADFIHLSALGTTATFLALFDSKYQSFQERYTNGNTSASQVHILQRWAKWNNCVVLYFAVILKL